jgi:uncharacterized protein (TIGR02271 family)
MALMKLDDFYPDHQNFSSELGSSLDDVKSYDVYSQENDKVGSVHDMLVDAQTGEFRYFVVDTGFWIFGKKVLLPIGLASISSADKRIYARSLTRDQVEALPNFSNLEEIDYNQEESVRDVYRPSVAAASATASTPAATDNTDNYDRNSYNYDRDAALYGINDRDHQTLKLYQERLIAGKQRQKTGEVAIGKTVETETAHVSVPIEREQVVIERVTPTQSSMGDTSDAFREESVRMEVYEETPDIRKETVLREEVRVRKEVDRDTVTADETVRREELDVNKQGDADVI